jgi:hypothetical protein
MNEEEKEKLISAYTLWKHFYITEEQFKNILDDIANTSEPEKSNYSAPEPKLDIRGFKVGKMPCNNKSTITEGQVKYITGLIAEGRIPSNQSLNLTRKEASDLISDALKKPKPRDMIEEHKNPEIPRQTAQDSAFPTPEQDTSQFPDY